MQLTWHGHSTWHVTVGETELLIDPFFDNPHTELEPSDIETPDFVLISHGHADHIGDAEAFADATLVAVPELTSYLSASAGFDEAIGGMGMNLGGTVSCGDAFVTMHRADHTNGINTDHEHCAGPPVGFIVSDANPGNGDSTAATTFYHAGDTALMTEMRDVIGHYLQPDAAALPIGDHFTMGPMQAAIATNWLGVDYAFPMHYNTFPPIEVNPERFRDELASTASEAEGIILSGDEAFQL